uniref:7TM_GPCR_Srx domain-containing protein n=1 Tax=Meloidogyne hapla TaxID=6305 RepID=A0A1I8BVR5_MELHA
MVKRNQIHCILRTLAFSTFDLLFSFIGICFHGTSPSYQHFRDDFAMPYKFNKSVSDFFMISSLRMLFLFVGCFILIFNRNQPSRPLGHLAHASFALSIILISFTPAKFLGLSDNTGTEHPGNLYIGDIILLISNVFFSILAHRIWLGFLRAAKRIESIYERLEEEEEEITSSEDEESKTQEGRISSDMKTHIITRIFVPYYTGQVIASVVSSTGDKYAALIDSVKLMLFISVVWLEINF